MSYLRAEIDTKLQRHRRSNLLNYFIGLILQFAHWAQFSIRTLFIHLELGVTIGKEL